MFRNKVTEFIEYEENKRVKQLVLIYEKGHTRPPTSTHTHIHTREQTHTPPTQVLA